MVVLLTDDEVHGERRGTAVGVGRQLIRAPVPVIVETQRVGAAQFEGRIGQPIEQGVIERRCCRTQAHAQGAGVMVEATGKGCVRHVLAPDQVRMQTNPGRVASAALNAESRGCDLENQFQALRLIRSIAAGYQQPGAVGIAVRTGAGNGVVFEPHGAPVSPDSGKVTAAQEHTLPGAPELETVRVQRVGYAGVAEN